MAYSFETLIRIIRKAGDSVLEKYETDITYDLKDDKSPVTSADRTSHRILELELSRNYPEIPILSEEASNYALSKRKKWKRFWLIDPLDGTKEFINRNGEFTINIALMEDNIPIAGVIHIPVIGETYYGANGKGSFRLKNKKLETISSDKYENNRALRILVSRSHLDTVTEENIEKIKNEYSCELIQTGSSVKFCQIASGKADLYIRLGLTSEWDIAAGEAILKASGGALTQIDGRPMSYNNKNNYLNDYFIASGDENLLEKILAIIA